MQNKNDSTFKNKHAQKESFTHKVGDSIERLGEKVSKAGATKIGNAIRNAGDKIEHSRDHKKSRDS